MFKLENKFLKTKEINSDKELLKNEITQAQKNKTKIFLEMGILLHKKIREEDIVDYSFEKMSDKLIELDKIIFENSVKLQEPNNKNNEIECECGNLISDENKFCSQCGKIVDIKADIQKTKCLTCETLIDKDSNYCVCCGSKLNNQIYTNEK